MRSLTALYSITLCLYASEIMKTTTLEAQLTPYKRSI